MKKLLKIFTDLVNGNCIAVGGAICKYHTWLVLWVLFFSCSKKADDPAPSIQKSAIDVSVRGYSAKTGSSEVILKPNAIMVGNDLNDRLIAQSQTSITYQNSTESNGIKEGEVLYSMPTGKAPDGYALLVVKKTVQGDKVVLETRAATMDEVFVKLKEEQKFKANFKENKPVFYDPMDVYNRNGRVTAGGALLSADRITKLELTEKSFEIDYIFYDLDKNYETKHDQITLGLELEHTLTNTNFDYDGDFKIQGEHKYSLTPSLSIQTSNDVTDKLYEISEKELKRQIVGKKIRLFSVPIPISNPAAALAVQTSLDFYVTIQLDIDGKLKAYVSYEDFGYKFNYDSGKKGSASASGLPDAKFDAGFEASAEGTILLALGMGLVIKFPAFETKPDGPSYVGLFAEVGIGAEAKAGLSLTKNDLLCRKYTFEPFVGWETYLEAELGILGKPIVEQRYSIYKPPFIKLNKKEWDSCKPKEEIGPFDIKTGLLAYYPFSGNTRDSSGNNLDAVALYGAVPTMDRNGIANKAYAFDGKKSVIKLTTSKASTVKYSDTTHVMNQIKDKLTLAAWVYVDKQQAGKFPIFSKSGRLIDPYYFDSVNDSHFYQDFEASFYAGAGKDYVSLSGANTTCFSESKVLLTNTKLDIDFPRGIWMHVATVHDGEKVRSYLNGALVNEVVAPKVSGKTCYQHAKSGHFSPLYIGAKYSGNQDGTDNASTYVAKGKIDEVYVFNRALAENDVKALYLSKN